MLIIYEAALEAPGSAVLAIPGAVELKAAYYQADDGRLIDIEAEFDAKRLVMGALFALPHLRLMLTLNSIKRSARLALLENYFI